MIFTEITQTTWKLQHNKMTKIKVWSQRTNYFEKKEIEETDICETQKEKDYSDSIWIVLSLNANQEDVDN